VGFGISALLYLVLMGSAPTVGGATPLAQRIAVKGLDPALGNRAGAKARTAAATKCQG
jgi:hypothetical protein